MKQSNPQSTSYEAMSTQPDPPYLSVAAGARLEPTNMLCALPTELLVMVFKNVSLSNALSFAQC